MVAFSRQSRPPLIRQHHVDAANGVVTLTIPDADDVLAATIKAELAGLGQNQTYPARFDFAHEGGKATITITSPDTTMLAMNVTKIMTRRVQVFDNVSQGEVVRYASLQDIKSVLGSLKEHAQKTSPNAAIAIDKLIGTAEQIERL